MASVEIVRVYLTERTAEARHALRRWVDPGNIVYWPATVDDQTE